MAASAYLVRVLEIRMHELKKSFHSKNSADCKAMQFLQKTSGRSMEFINRGQKLNGVSAASPPWPRQSPTVLLRRLKGQVSNLLQQRGYRPFRITRELLVTETVKGHVLLCNKRSYLLDLSDGLLLCKKYGVEAVAPKEVTWRPSSYSRVSPSMLISKA